jgi:integrase
MQYSVRIDKKTGIYFLDVRDPSLPSGRTRPSLETRDQAEAERLAKDVIASLLPTARAAGYQQLKEALLFMANSKKNEETRKSYRQKVPVLCRGLGGEDANLLALDREDIEAHVQARLAQDVKHHTVHKELSLLRQTWAHFCPGRADPVPQISANYVPEKRFLTVEEAAKLLHAAKGSKFISWLWFALYTGAEPAAMRRMGWQHVDFQLGMAHVLGTKTVTRDRYVPLSDGLRSFLDTLDRGKPMLPYWGGNESYRPLTRWCRNAEIEYCTLKDLRRTFGSWLKQAGVDSKRVADLMGHTTTAMVDRVYGQLNAASYRDAVAQLPKLPKLVVV